ncbi:MAG: alpha/beta fold hydrolase [Verrucomicrobiota bacterium]
MLAYQLNDVSKEGPLVLFLHGLGIGGWAWNPVIEGLRNTGSVVLDLPGHGNSNDIIWRSIAETAERVAEVVDRLPVDRDVHLTGHSLGAYVGLEVLLKCPDRFSSALLSGFHIGKLKKSALLKLAYVVNEMIFSTPWLRRWYLPRLFGEGAFAKRLIQEASKTKSGTIRRAGCQVVEATTLPSFQSLGLPVLAVAGDQEPEAIRSMPDRLAEKFPNVEGKLLENRGHLWPLLEPSLYAALLMDWIQAL